MKKTDFLVIGSGIAGLSFALRVAEHGKVIILTKGDEDESNTKYAQGGVAAVADFNHDSYDKHINDTLIAGDGLCDRKIVDIVVKEGPLRIKELIEWGAQFDKNSLGEFDLAREGGHSEHRVLHHKDVTGMEIERTLLKQIQKHPNIELYTHYFAIDLITEHHLGKNVSPQSNAITCFGVYALDTRTNKIERILSKSTLLATGGAGQVYKTTTNPKIATGDGIAMTWRAKAQIKDMEFIQFHPTALYNPGESPSFLISEAVRGFGAVLKTRDGEEFMQNYDERLSLAPRDIVARAIDSEMKKHGDDCVYLDCRHLDKKKFIDHFPNIYDKCLSLNIDIMRDMIPVAPAAHYLCGGITVDEFGQTTIKQLYACGECACTGLHGANRLASNSLLEAMVFAYRSFEHVTANITSYVLNENIPEWQAEGTSNPKERILITHNRRELQALMSDYVGIVRNNLRLERALARIELIEEDVEELYEKTVISPQLCELRNLAQVASLIVRSCMLRHESRGLNYNVDYPEKLGESADTVIN